MKDNKNDLKKTLKTWAIICFILGIIVYPLTNLMPLNKKIYSVSFSMLTSSSSGFTILGLVILLDILPKRSQTMQSIVNITIRPFLWLGRNPLFVFVFMDLLAIIMIKYIIIDDKSIWSWFYKYCFREWIDNDNVASVVFACFFLALWMAAAAVLYWKKIFIRL
jgi:predicted acyltransferase